ncbi:MAG: PEP-CTERM sorting domain-containing protein [Myxococcota bacterium]
MLATDQTVSLSGGYGALSGDDIVWTGPVTYSVAGTFTCSGECSALRFAFGTSPIASLLYNGVEASPVDPVVLGTWTLDAGLTSILATTRATTSISRGGYAPLGAPMSWLVFGPSDLGEVPEPASSIMVVLGLGGLSLRLIAQRLRPPYPAIHPDRLESSSSSI